MSPNQGFFYWGDGGSPPTRQKFAQPPPPRKTSPSRLPPPTTKSQFRPPHTKQQFSSYNPIKTLFLAVVIAPAPFLFNFDFN